MAMSNLKYRKSDCNHIFLNFVPCMVIHPMIVKEKVKLHSGNTVVKIMIPSSNNAAGSGNNGGEMVLEIGPSLKL